MIDLARLHLARLLLVLGGACVRLVPWAARRPSPSEVTVGRALLLLSGASAWLARRLVTADPPDANRPDDSLGRNQGGGYVRCNK
jgi:hypothetical protein